MSLEFLACRNQYISDFVCLSNSTLKQGGNQFAPSTFSASGTSNGDQGAVLAACEAGGQWQKVLDLMDLQSRDVVAWCALAGAYRASRKWQQAKSEGGGGWSF